MSYLSTRARLAAVAVGAILAGTIAVHAQSETPQIVDGKLQPLADGFPSEPLQIFVNDDPGSADSIYATQLVKAAEAISPVSIRIEHVDEHPNFPSWAFLAWLKEQGQRSDDGYMMYVFTWPGNTTDLLVEDIKTAVGVDENDINPIVLTEKLPYFIHQRADAPWGDKLEDLVKHAKENPGTVRYISGGPGGGQDAAMKWYLTKLDFTVDEIIGGSSGERALTVASGEGDITVSPPDTLLPHFEGGKVDVLMMSGDRPAPEPWAGVPNAKDLGLENDPWGTSRGLTTTTAVPESHRNWLETLFIAAGKTEGFLADRQKVPGIIMENVGHDLAMERHQTILDAALPIMKAAGVYWRDKKN